MTTIDKAPDLPFFLKSPQIVWHPPFLGSPMDLAVGYAGSSLSELKEPSGAHIQFSDPDNVRPNRVSVHSKNSNMKEWNFSDFSIQYGSDHNLKPAGEIDFDKRTKDGSELIREIVLGHKLMIEIIPANGEAVVGKFDLSRTIEGDQMLSKARSMIESSAANVCRPIGQN